MNIKWFKYFFISTIVVLLIAGTYIIYIKEKKSKSNLPSSMKEKEISKNITIGITEFDTINPILTKSLEMQQITKLLYEPLIDITEDFDTKPIIAKECSKINNLTYIIRLNEEKKWEDGHKIEPEDIEYTIKQIQKSDSIYKTNIETIEKIEKIDNNTIKIHLKKPTQFFEYCLCFPIVRKNNENADMPMGTGRYKVESLNENEIKIKGPNIEITVNIYKNITELYNQFIRENVDLIITQNTNYERYIGNIGFEENIITGREFFYLSCENIKDKQERNNIKNCINKQKLIYDLYNKKYRATSFPLGYGSYLNKEETQIDMQTVSNKNTLTLSTSKEDENIGEKIKEQLEEKDIKVKLINYQSSSADLILKKTTVPITPEISIYFKNEDLKNKIVNIEQIENKQILKEKYEEIIEKYYEETPFISLYFNTYIILHTNKLKGDFSGNWYNMFYNIDTWYKVAK